MRTDELDYTLPSELIATSPAEPRDAARLMVCDRATGEVSHHHVRDLPTLGLFGPGDLMVVNQTRVLPAYLEGVRVNTGGKVTGLFLEETLAVVKDAIDSPSWRVLLECGGRLEEYESIDLLDPATGEACVRLFLEHKNGRGEWDCEVSGGGSLRTTAAILRRVGRTPLPPYIRKARRQRHESEFTDADARRYNTVYAKAARRDGPLGSVAAPTAGLHFTPGLLAQLDAAGVSRAAVTLHVGQGTFLPVQGDVVEEHPIHSEWYHVGDDAVVALLRAKQAGGRILAVGTTSVRTLESLPDLDTLLFYAKTKDLPGFGKPKPPPRNHMDRVMPPDWVGSGHFPQSRRRQPDSHHDIFGDTQLFITPDTGHAFRYTDRLMTNFHLPRSTLLALVAALPGVGIERLRAWYDVAIAQRYRFYSFGDAMLIV